MAQRHVAARRRPGQRHADQHAHDARAERKLQGVDQRGVVLRAREGALEMLDTERLRQTERTEHQPQQRIADQEQQQHNGEAEHDALDAEPSAPRARGQP